jgi:hypothetical protein
VDEGIVERGEDTGNAENELACTRLLVSSMRRIRITSNIPSPARGPRETFSLAAVVVFLGGILGVLVVGWNMEQEKKRKSRYADGVGYTKSGDCVCPTNAASR